MLATDMIGSHLGPYKIEAPIGAGGMGEVFRAHDTRLRRTVALPQVLAGLGLFSLLNAGCLIWLQRLQPLFFAVAVGSLLYQLWIVRRRPPTLQLSRCPAVRVSDRWQTARARDRQTTEASAGSRPWPSSIAPTGALRGR